MITSKGFKKYFANTSWLFVGRSVRMAVAFFVGVYVARFIDLFICNPKVAEVYNLGGGRDNSCSIIYYAFLLGLIGNNGLFGQ